MVKLNSNFGKLTSSYLFPQIEKKVSDLKARSPSSEIINLGIGDITKPLPEPIVKAIVDAILELENDVSKARYGPSIGFSFLRKAIAKNDYLDLGIDENDIFISNGAKCDIANIQELFDTDSIVAICDPTYPVYVDSNVIAGRTGFYQDGKYQKIVYLPCEEKNNFFPKIPDVPVDLIYLCSPNNPTGTALPYDELKKWVDYAIQNKAVIIFDGAYEAFINTKNTPHSIYEIEGAKKCAIEIRSFSKKAGFTGLRCSYTVVPHELKVQNTSIRECWVRRCETKFGGVPYPIQMGALATYSDKGKQSIDTIISEYVDQMKTLTSGLKSIGWKFYGGVDAPYVWVKAPSSSWEFFDELLTKAKIISIPGAGFGSYGEGYIRLSAFAPKEHIETALNRLSGIYTCATQ